MNEKCRELVFQALGEASMCWKPSPSTEIFDSTKCEGVGERLIAALDAESPEPTTNKAIACASQIAQLLSSVSEIENGVLYNKIYSKLVEIIEQLRNS